VFQLAVLIVKSNVTASLTMEWLAEDYTSTFSYRLIHCLNTHTHTQTDIDTMPI